MDMLGGRGWILTGVVEDWVSIVVLDHLGIPSERYFESFGKIKRNLADILVFQKCVENMEEKQGRSSMTTNIRFGI